MHKMKTKIVISHQYPPENRCGSAVLASELGDRLPETDIVRASNYDEFMSEIVDAEIAMAHRLTGEQLADAKNLSWVQALTSGYNRFDREKFADQNIILTTVSGVHAEPIAQHVLGYVLTFERGLLEAKRQQQRKEWRRFTPSELTGKTIGIIGLGAIGSRIAERLDSFDVSLVGVKNNPDTGPEMVDDIRHPDQLHSVLGESDYVIISCPLTAETEGMIDSRAFSSMDRDTILINIARGEIIDQPALIEALQTGNLAGAALDVMTDEPLPSESPLWDLENVIITPHMAGGSPQFARRSADIFEENHKLFIKGEVDKMLNRVY
jgi:phosphoglycerate dehydrogenase-like enzyme